ncbi:D-serine ammonia-lyase [Megamonas hypermegale]|uniref:D-serine ammonia-lyase n=1 Tax=Megamonas hypermegale TaxID=158847 RepID=UPI0026F11841|nr:D-serine ammonia-lyase [Megamonas hypermegale]
MENFKHFFTENSVLSRVQKAQETIWLNRHKQPFAKCAQNLELDMSDINDAEARLSRFAPLIEKLFPETQNKHGIIESPLIYINNMKTLLRQKYNAPLEGKLLLKQDSHLAVAGSVKARGGIYEILKHTEDLAVEHNLITPGDDYTILVLPQNRNFFRQYTVQVGSTGNLGLSIGIISAAIGYKVIVHMSADAKQWKKDLLKKYGVIVKEYSGDYGEAVKHGRSLSEQNPASYFVDDENSRNLFLGYSVAGKRLQQQLKSLDITVDERHPLFVYIPCGVGGAPGGISFGLKQIYKDNVHCFFIEPVQAPSMLIGMATGLNNKISVQDIGLTGSTQADGLAVGRPSSFVGEIMQHLLSGIFTVNDKKLYRFMQDLNKSEHIFLEPSACAAFQGICQINGSKQMKQYLQENNLSSKMTNATHIVWATGGSLVPADIQQKYLSSVF